MGRYSNNYTPEQMLKFGFITKKDYSKVPSKYKNRRSMYFRIYDLGTKFAQAYLNIGLGSLEIEKFKSFKSPSLKYKKALRL